MRVRVALCAAALYALSPRPVWAQGSAGDSDELLEESLDDPKDAPKDRAKDAAKEEPREPAKEPSKESKESKEPPKQIPKKQLKELTPDDAIKSVTRRPPDQVVIPIDAPKDARKDASKEASKEAPKEAPKDVPKKEPKETLKPAEKPKDNPRAASAAAALEQARPVAVMSEADLKTSIEARARFSRNGDQALADAELQTIVDIRHQIDARNVVIASASLIHEATEALSVGRIDRAIELVETASMISPDLPQAHWLRLRLYAKRNWTQLDKIFASLSDLLSAKLTCFRNLVVLISNTIAVISIALFATILGFTLIQILKYMRYASHDFVRILPSWLGSGEGAMLLIIAIATPLVFGFGVAPSIVLALGVIYPYQAPEERTLSKWAFGGLALAPILIFAVAPLVTFHGSIADALDSASTEAFAVDAEAKLTEWEKGAGRNDIQGALVLARRYRMRGDLANAESEYRRALVAEPHNTVARNNLGTLLYLAGHEEQSKAMFQMATNGSEIAEPFLNLASVLLDGSNFDEANAAIERARRLNRDLAEAYTKLDASVPTAKKMLYAESSESSLWLRLMDVDMNQRTGVTDEVWGLIGGETPWFMMPAFVLLVAAIAVLIGRKADEIKLSVACPKCGVPAERDAPARYCEQCQSIFLKGIAVEPSLRLEKETDVRNYQRRRRWLERGLAVVAGGGHMFGERPWLGALLLFAFFGLVANMFWTEGLIAHPWSLGREASSSLIQLLACGFAALILVLVSVRQAFR